jgi:archaellum component FlaF (FlaF/FlaG flagellin family)
MLGQNDLDLFLADFGVPVVLNGSTVKGIFDSPTNVTAEGMILTNDYVVTLKTPSITVNGTAYTVRDARMMDDGAFCEILVTKT